MYTYVYMYICIYVADWSRSFVKVQREHGLDGHPFKYQNTCKYTSCILQIPSVGYLNFAKVSLAFSMRVTHLP